MKERRSFVFSLKPTKKQRRLLQGQLNECRYICIEDLKIEKMIKGSHYAKSITDVSWNQFGLDSLGFSPRSLCLWARE